MSHGVLNIIDMNTATTRTSMCHTHRNGNASLRSGLDEWQSLALAQAPVLMDIWPFNTTVCRNDPMCSLWAHTHVACTNTDAHKYNPTHVACTNTDVCIQRKIKIESRGGGRDIFLQTSCFCLHFPISFHHVGHWSYGWNDRDRSILPREVRVTSVTSWESSSPPPPEWKHMKERNSYSPPQVILKGSKEVIFMCEGATHTCQGTWVESRGQLPGACFLFHHMGIRDRTQVFRLGNKHLFPFNHLVGPIGYISASLSVNLIGSEVETRKGVMSRPRYPLGKVFVSLDLWEAVSVFH